MKISFDTNTIVYLESGENVSKREILLSLLEELPVGNVVIPVQVLGELYNVLVKKGKWGRNEARDTILGWHDMYTTVPTTPEIFAAAVDLAAEHRLQIWDAVILSASSQIGCRLLLTEDLQDGFQWGGVTVVNPFASPRHPLLQAIMARSGPQV